ncbi:MAG: RNA polymerase sigma factor [bacterium]
MSEEIAPAIHLSVQGILSEIFIMVICMELVSLGGGFSIVSFPFFFNFTNPSYKQLHKLHVLRMPMELDRNQTIPNGELLKECLNGKEWAWEAFHERFSRLINATIFQTARVHWIDLKPEDMRDCEQAIWSSFLENECNKLRCYRGDNGCTLATWLRTCTVNATLNFLDALIRSTSRYVPLGENAHPVNKEIENVERHIAEQEELERVMKIIRENLTSRERLFVTFHWLDEMSFNEISPIMNLPPRNLYVLKHRIQKKIRRLLKQFTQIKGGEIEV